MHPQEQLPSMQGRTGASKKNVILEFGGWNIKSKKAVVTAALSYFLLMLTTYFVLPVFIENSAYNIVKRWGDPNPSAKCDRQARIATLLAFLLGPLGMDQFYAHHWVCATFKLLISWLGSGFYTVSRVRDSVGFMALGRMLALGSAVWCVTDLILWIVGGHYGTHGCPVGNPAWQH